MSWKETQSVVRYQRLNNGARSKFDSKRISRDSGIVEDGTEEDVYKIYQNPDFERQEMYAKLENVIKNPEMIKRCKFGTRDNHTKRKRVRINESNNELCELVNDVVNDVSNKVVREVPLTSYAIGDDEYDYTELPMDRYGSAWGSYYHDHPYIGRHEPSYYERNENTGNATTSFSNIPRRRITSDDNDERAPFLLDRIRKRKKEINSFHAYRTPYRDAYELSTVDEDTYFDTYGGYSEVPPDTMTQIQRWSTAINRFFHRTKTLRNIRMFWQQILCTIFIILGRDLNWRLLFYLAIT